MSSVGREAVPHRWARVPVPPPSNPHQLALGDIPPEEDDPAVAQSEETREQRARRELLEHPRYADFCEYHASHPETYEFFKEMAFKAHRRGYEHIGIKWLVEIGRWETGKDFSIGSGFTHEYLTLYSRLLTLKEQPLAHIFELRKLKANHGKGVGSGDE